MQTRNMEGMSLLELLFVLAISAVLASIALPGLGALIKQSEHHIAISTTISTFDRARSLAVNRSRWIGLCAVDEYASCTDDWSGAEIAIFVDNNRNRRWDTGDEEIFRQPWSKPGLNLRWSNWRGDQTIVYQADGSVVSNGTLYFDTVEGEPLATLVLNKSGRVRVQNR